jgi:hypothetical protein
LLDAAERLPIYTLLRYTPCCSNALSTSQALLTRKCMWQVQVQVQAVLGPLPSLFRILHCPESLLTFHYNAVCLLCKLRVCRPLFRTRCVQLPPDRWKLPQSRVTNSHAKKDAEMFLPLPLASSNEHFSQFPLQTLIYHHLAPKIFGAT